MTARAHFWADMTTIFYVNFSYVGSFVCSLSSKHLAQRSDADYSSVYNVLNLCPDTNTDKDVRQGKGTFKPDTATGLEEKHTHIFKFFWVQYLITRTNRSVHHNNKSNIRWYSMFHLRSVPSFCIPTADIILPALTKISACLH